MGRRAVVSIRRDARTEAATCRCRAGALRLGGGEGEGEGRTCLGEWIIENNTFYVLLGQRGRRHERMLFARLLMHPKEFVH